MLFSPFVPRTGRGINLLCYKRAMAYEAELKKIAEFLMESTGIRVSLPEVQISCRIRDIEEYSVTGNKNAKIVINPCQLDAYKKKIGEKIPVSALLAHSFFHHAQHTLGVNYRKIAREFVANSFGVRSPRNERLIEQAAKT